MKTLLLSALFCLGTALVANADPVITFDDLPSTQVPVPAGYHGLDWINFDYLDAQTYGLNPSGYQAGIVSDYNVSYGVGGETAVLSAEMFDLVSAYATAAWNTNLQFVAKGYLKGTLVYSQTNTLSATNSTLVNFGFYGVDEVDFTASGGGQYAGYSGKGTEFVLDNVNVVTYLPYTSPAVTNGGFETGNFSGWFTNGSSNFTYVTNSSGFVRSGSYGVQAGPLAPWNLYQFVGPLQVGQSYTISFWLENPVGGGSSSFSALWAGFPVFGLTNSSAFGWTNIQLNVLATSPTPLLQFQLVNTLNYFGLDDITVTPAELAANGGFETGNFSGWTPSGNSSKDTVTTSAVARRAGTFGAAFAASGSPGFISQSVATYPGQPYLVSLWLDSPDGQTPNQFQAAWGTQTLANQPGLAAFGWTNLHYTVVNSSTQATLQFGLQDNSSSLGLDEVSVQAVPMIKNGGFEFGDTTGWTASGNSSETFVSTNSLYAFSGFYGAKLGPVGSLGFLSQALTTVPGQAYLISFWMDNPTIMTNTEFRVAWNGSILLDATNLGAVGWQLYEFLVTASGATSTLEFGFDDTPSYLGLDQVFVAPVSAPVLLSIAKSSKLTDLSWTAMPGYFYELEYITNLTHTNWSPVGAIFAPSTLPMTGTDTNLPSVDRFYRVLMFPPLIID